MEAQEGFWLVLGGGTKEGRLTLPSLVRGAFWVSDFPVSQPNQAVLGTDERLDFSLTERDWVDYYLSIVKNV